MAARVGFIGLGYMGAPMARNVMKHGHSLTVYDIVPTAVEALAREGAAAATSPAEVAAASDITITIVPDAPDVEAAALGQQGIIEGLKPEGLYVDMSTIDPATTRRVGARLAERGLRMIDCPVGKTQDHAVAGTLTLMAGGNAEWVEEAEPVLMCMGETLFHCGGLGTGEAMKLVNNCLASTIMNAVSEALVSGTKAGLSLELMREVMGTTMAANAHLSFGLEKKAFHGDFTPGFKLDLAHKDVRLALAMAKDAEIDTPVGTAALGVIENARQAGYGSNDATVVLKFRETQGGVTVRMPQ
ncbi:MAG: NAD(P)-binding domain-containing protein [Pseudomonadota bacterium]